jgi:hypothetical protein
MTTRGLLLMGLGEAAPAPVSGQTERTRPMKRIWIIPAVVALLLATSARVGGAQAKGISGVPGAHAVMQVGTIATYAFAINSRGDIAGTYVTRTGTHGFLLHNGTYTAFDVPAATGGTHPHNINVAGDIVGTYIDGQNHDHGFLLHDGTYTTLDVP